MSIFRMYSKYFSYICRNFKYREDENKYRRVEKSEFNPILIVVLYFLSILGLLYVLRYTVLYQSGVEDLKYIPIILTAINVFLLLHTILKDKNINGFWILTVLNIFKGIISLFSEDKGIELLRAAVLITTVSLLLLIKKNGISGWSVLKRNSRHSEILLGDIVMTIVICIFAFCYIYAIIDMF